MQIIDILDPARIVTGAQATSKKRALEMASEMLAASSEELGQAEVFSALLGREKLGSTGLGHGVALPHGRLGTCGQPVGAHAEISQCFDHGPSLHQAPGAVHRAWQARCAGAER